MVFFKSKLLHLFDLFAKPVDHEDLVGGRGFVDAELEGCEARAGWVGGAEAAEEKDCCEENAREKEKN